jgi:hypothetical protein
VTAALWLGVLFFLVLPVLILAWLLSCVIRNKDRADLSYHRQSGAPCEAGIRVTRRSVVYEDSFAAQMARWEPDTGR